jgi:uncharacterized protein GlcG (DUF336 family)
VAWLKCRPAPFRGGLNVRVVAVYSVDMGGNAMRRQVLTSLIVSAAVLVAGELQAQQPAPPNLDAVPEKMPFNTPYGSPITADRASAVIQAAVAESKKRDWQMNIAVVDSGGNLVAFLRMDNAQLASIPIAEHKARAAVKYRRPTRAFEDAVQKFDFKYILSLDDVVASRGGIPLVEGGKIIGAVGCSGGTGSQDEAICTAAAAVVNK